MNPSEILRIVDAIHRDKNIDKEILFRAIESAILMAAKKHYGEEADLQIEIDRKDGSIRGSLDGVALDPEETIGRIGAQTAKQVIIQKIREAERDALYDEYEQQLGQIVSGIVQRNEGGATLVSLGNVDAILPRSEQIKGQSHDPNERVRATVFDVKKQGSRVKVVISRTRPQLVQRLFESEIPEIAEGAIAIEAIAREPGYRSKVAVSTSDPRIDCVGACVGVRGNRIKNIVDELSGERIDIVRWSDDMQALIPNALQPATVDEVILCKMMGRAIVLVNEDQLSLAIGKRGQNVRLASKLCKWDIEIMTREELEQQIELAVKHFSQLKGMTEEVAEMLVGEGFLSYDDLSVIEPDDLMRMGHLSEEQVEAIIEQAEDKAEEAEQAAAADRQRRKDLDRVAATAEAAELAEKSESEVESKVESEVGAEAESEVGAEVESEVESGPELEVEYTSDEDYLQQHLAEGGASDAEFSNEGASAEVETSGDADRP